MLKWGIYLILVLFLVLLIPFVLAENATIRDGNCLGTETCFFSMYQQNNSHVAVCGHYNYSLCYPSSVIVNLREGNCTSDERCLLSQFQQNNSHVGRCNYYNYSLCIDGNWNVHFVDTSCNSTDALITFFQHNNSHIGSLEHYNYTLCLKKIISVPPEVVEHRGSSSGMGKEADRISSVIIEKEQTVKGDLYSIDNLIPGLTLLNITDPGLSIYRVEMDSSKEAENVEIKIEESKNTKLKKPDRRVYRYVTIETDLPKSFINQVKLIFKVQKIFGKDIKLLRYVGYWEELETNKLYENDYYEHYESISKGFSVFAISAEKFKIVKTIEKIAQEVTIDKPSKTEIWLYALLPILILMIGGLTLLYHLRKLIITYKKLSFGVLLLSVAIIILIIPFTNEVLYWAIFPLSIITVLVFVIIFCIRKYLVKPKIIRKLKNIFVKKEIKVVIYGAVKKPKRKKDKKRKKSKLPSLQELKEVFGKKKKSKKRKKSKLPSLQELKEVFGKKKKSKMPTLQELKEVLGKKKVKKKIFTEEELKKYSKKTIKKYKL